MSNKAYFYQIDKNREQLEAFMDWVDYSNPAWSYFNYAFYRGKFFIIHLNIFLHISDSNSKFTIYLVKIYCTTVTSSKNGLSSS